MEIGVSVDLYSFNYDRMVVDVIVNVVIVVVIVVVVVIDVVAVVVMHRCRC